MSQEEPKRKRKLFADISAVQVIATALAAVTSMLLSSYIGIAGSVIGVAVASIVSTLAASLYKKFLADSANKLKQIPVATARGETLADIFVGHGGQDASDAPSDEQKATETAMKASPEVKAGDEPNELGAKTDGAPLSSDRSEEPGQTAPLTLTPAEQEELDEVLRHQRKMVRGLIVVCVVSALLAVGASAAVVYIATTGQGLGQKTSPITWITKDDSNTSSSHGKGSAGGSSQGSDGVNAAQETSDPSNDAVTNTATGSQAGTAAGNQAEGTDTSSGESGSSDGSSNTTEPGTGTTDASPSGGADTDSGQTTQTQ